MSSSLPTGAGRAGAVGFSFVFVLAVAMCSARAGAQETVATHTRASNGARIGAVVGGVAVGLGAGLLVAGLCDAADCDGSFAKGAAVGVLVGSGFGAAGGAIVGAAIPAGGRRAGDGRLTLRVGIRAGPKGNLGRRAPWASAGILDGTTATVRVGLETAVLGGFEEGGAQEDVGVPRRDRFVWMAGLVATWGLGSQPETGSYGLVSLAVYPVHESLFFLAPPPPDGEPSEGVRVDHSVTPYPGVGVGFGAARPLSGWLRLAVEARLHLITGVGPGLVLPLLSLEGGLEIG